MNASVRPLQLALTPEGLLQIDWSDGQTRRYAISELRDRCPCATCREKRTEQARPPAPGVLPVLSLAETRPLTLVQMTPIGNYAYGIQFSDGHDTGIYTFELLRELGAVVEG